MKLTHITLSALLFTSHFALGMDLMNSYDNKMLWIAAVSENKNAFSRTSPYLFKLITGENILKEYPQYLNKKDLLYLMVKYAKTDNEKMIELAIQKASTCGYHDALQIISYFINDEDSATLDILDLFKEDRNPNECLTALLPTIMAVYSGTKKTIKIYKKKYSKNTSPRDHISALHVASFNNHLSVAELLLSQKEELLNEQTFFENLTPLHIAVNQKNVPLCTFLLSFKNIKTTLLDSDILTPLDVAASLRNSEIIELFLRHEKRTI